MRSDALRAVSVTRDAQTTSALRVEALCDTVLISMSLAILTNIPGFSFSYRLETSIVQ